MRVNKFIKSNWSDSFHSVRSSAVERKIKMMMFRSSSVTNLGSDFGIANDISDALNQLEQHDLR